MTKRKWVLKAVIFSALRRLFRRSPQANQCLNDAKIEVRIKGKTVDNIRRVKFKCACCGELFDKKHVQIDHIESVIPLQGLPEVDGEPDYQLYIKRLFCGVEGLQILCSTCHKRKSKEENAVRRRVKSDVKPKQRKTKKPVPNNRGRKRERTKTSTKRSLNKSSRKMGRHKNTRSIR